MEASSSGGEIVTALFDLWQLYPQGQHREAAVRKLLCHYAIRGNLCRRLAAELDQLDQPSDNMLRAGVVGVLAELVSKPVRQQVYAEKLSGCNHPGRTKVRRRIERWCANLTAALRELRACGSHEIQACVADLQSVCEMVLVRLQAKLSVETLYRASLLLQELKAQAALLQP